MKYIILINPHSGKELLINFNRVVAIEEGTNSTKIWTENRSFEVKESLDQISAILNNTYEYSTLVS